MRKSLILGVAVLSATALHAEFKAGFARVDITPPLGIPVQGYFDKRISDGVLDPLCVDCVAVHDGTNAGLIYSVDIVGLADFFMEMAFSAITAATGVPRERIYVHATHTHTAAAYRPRETYTKEENALVKLYSDFLLTRLADAGRFALADLSPSRIGVAETECRGISFIRRYRMKDGSVVTNPKKSKTADIVEPIGTPDESLKVVRFRREGAPDIAIVNFGTHPDTIGGTKFSADWPGVVRRTFEAGVGGGVKCLFLNAAQGDVNHWARLNVPPGRKALKRGKTTHLYMGRVVAGAAMGVWDVCEEVPAGAVRGIAAMRAMPQNIPTEQELKWIEMFDAGRKDEIPLGYMELTILTKKGSRARRLKGAAPTADMLVSTLAIGDSLAFAGLPCEPFVDIGRAIKRQSPFRFTVITCLTNGSYGYVPSTAAHSQGGYEGLASKFAAPTGDMLVAAQLEQLSKLKGAKTEGNVSP